MLFPSREEWRSGGSNFENGFRVRYRNEHKTSKGVRIGVYEPKTSLFRALGRSPIIFQAEIYAIGLYVRVNLDKDLLGTNIYIHAPITKLLRKL